MESSILIKSKHFVSSVYSFGLKATFSLRLYAQVGDTGAQRWPASEESPMVPPKRDQEFVPASLTSIHTIATGLHCPAATGHLRSTVIIFFFLYLRQNGFRKFVVIFIGLPKRILESLKEKTRKKKVCL